jgi:hypothetical protein
MIAINIPVLIGMFGVALFLYFSVAALSLKFFGPSEESEETEDTESMKGNSNGKLNRPLSFLLLPPSSFLLLPPPSFLPPPSPSSFLRRLTSTGSS